MPLVASLSFRCPRQLVSMMEASSPLKALGGGGSSRSNSMVGGEDHISRHRTRLKGEDGNDDGDDDDSNNNDGIVGDVDIDVDGDSDEDGEEEEVRKDRDPPPGCVRLR